MVEASSERECRLSDVALQAHMRSRHCYHLKQALLDEGKKDKALNLAQKIDKMRKIPLVGGGQ